MSLIFGAAAAGLVCGIFSGFGVGGGSLLMVWMTVALSMDQRLAQGINLLYFLPTALSALLFHSKRHVVAWKSIWPAILTGALFAALAAWIAVTVEIPLLRRLFGVFLLLTGLSELLWKPKRPAE